MNWVGGSRKRIIMKNDTKKQREFFARKKLQNKLQTLGLPTSPKSKGTGSMDLVTLFIVNQIASKKTNNSQPRVTHFRDLKGPKKAKPGELVALPMSPCSPSRLPLAEAQPLHSTPFERSFMKKRKHNLPLFKQPVLSPVLESGMSDISATDYQHSVRDSFSPFSVASPASVSSAGLFPSHQPPRTHTAPHPWDITQPDQSQFNPYLQPSGGRDRELWLGDQAGTSGLIHTSTPVTRHQFGGIETIASESRGHDTHTAAFPFSVSEKSESQEPFFRDFCSNEYHSEAPYDNRPMNIHLPEEPAFSTRTQDTSETFMSSTVQLGGIAESQCRDRQQDQVRDVFTFADTGKGDTFEQASMKSESPSYSPRESYEASASDDEEDHCCCHSHTHAALRTDRADKAESSTVPFNLITQNNLSDAQPQCYGAEKGREVSKSGHPGPCNAARDPGSLGWAKDQFVPARNPSADTQSPAASIAPRPAPQTRDMGTQTTPTPRPTLSEAFTQCSLLLDMEDSATQTEHHHQYSQPPAPIPAVSPCASRRQHEHKDESERARHRWQGSAATLAETHTPAHTHTHTQERNTSWQAPAGSHTKTPELRGRFGPAPAVVPLRTWAQRRPVRQACVDADRPPTPFLGGKSLFQHAEEVRGGQPPALREEEEERQEGDGRVAEESTGRERERGREAQRCENPTVSEAMVRVEAGARETEVAAEERGAKSSSEEADTLQEIADILLMMKRRKKNLK